MLFATMILIIIYGVLCIIYCLLFTQGQNYCGNFSLISLAMLVQSTFLKLCDFKAEMTQKKRDN